MLQGKEPWMMDPAQQFEVMNNMRLGSLTSMPPPQRDSLLSSGLQVPPRLQDARSRYSTVDLLLSSQLSSYFSTSSEPAMLVSMHLPLLAVGRLLTILHSTSQSPLACLQFLGPTLCGCWTSYSPTQLGASL